MHRGGVRRIRRQGARRARGRAARPGLSLAGAAGDADRRRSPNVCVRRAPTTAPLDMRPYVCGRARPRDRRVGGERRDDARAAPRRASLASRPADLSRAAGRVSVELSGADVRPGEPRLRRAHPAAAAVARRPRSAAGARRLRADRRRRDGAPPAAGDRRDGRRAHAARRRRARSRRQPSRSSALLDLEAELVALLAAGEQAVALSLQKCGRSIAAIGSVASTTKRVPAGCVAHPRARSSAPAAGISARARRSGSARSSVCFRLSPGLALAWQTPMLRFAPGQSRTRARRQTPRARGRNGLHRAHRERLRLSDRRRCARSPRSRRSPSNPGRTYPQVVRGARREVRRPARARSPTASS